MLYNIRNINNKQMIIVKNFKHTQNAILSFYNRNKKMFETKAFIGKNGITSNLSLIHI